MAQKGGKTMIFCWVTGNWCEDYEFDGEGDLKCDCLEGSRKEEREEW